MPMGLSGLEPPTSRLSGVRSNRLSYKPSSLDFRTAMQHFHSLSLVKCGEFASLRSANVLASTRFFRKEVIQPHLPIRLPCYDFTPVTRPAFDNCSPLIRTNRFFSSPPGRIFLQCYETSGFVTNAVLAHKGLAHWLRAFLTPMV